MSMTLKTTKNLCFGLSVVFKITTRRSTIDVRKKSDLSRKNRTTGPPGHVRKISGQPQPDKRQHVINRRCCCCSAYAQIVRVAHSWVRSSCCLDGFFSRFSTLIISSEISLSLPTSSLNISSYFNFVALFPTFWQVWRICSWVSSVSEQNLQARFGPLDFLWLVFTDNIEALVLIIALHCFLVSLFM